MLGKTISKTMNYSGSEAEYIAERIEELISHQQISPRDICIVVKQTAQKFTDEINSALEEGDIQFRNEATFQDLLKEDIVILILNTLKSALDTKNSDAWSFIWNAKIFFEGKSGTANIHSIDELKRKLKVQLKIVKESLQTITHQEALDVLLTDIVNFYDINKLRKHYLQYSQGDYINKLREELTKYLFQYYVIKNKWISAIDSFQGYDSIPIMTIHKSKGLEFEAVFFVGFDDNAFWTFSFQKEEDTCTFFVGLSRSKKYLYFTFSENRFGKINTHNNIAPLYKILKESKIVEERYIGFN